MNNLYRVLGMSKQCFHQKLKRYYTICEELQAILQIVKQIRQDHPKLSVRKMYCMIAPKTIGRDRFLQVCFDAGFRVNVTKNYHKTTNSLGVTRFDNLLIDRKFPKKQDDVWVSDITYFRIGDVFYYLTFIIDLFSRKILGFAASEDLFTENTSYATLKMAIQCRKKIGIKVTGVIFHSDGGGQYYSKLFQELTRAHHFKNSMAEDVYENPYAERVNGIIKNEYMIPYMPNNFSSLRILLAKAVRLYNNERPHISLGMRTPVEFEKLKI